MKMNVVISEKFLVELSLKKLDELENRNRKLLNLAITEYEIEMINSDLSYIEQLRESLYEIKEEMS